MAFRSAICSPHAARQILLRNRGSSTSVFSISHISRSPIVTQSTSLRASSSSSLTSTTPKNNLAAESNIISAQRNITTDSRNSHNPLLARVYLAVGSNLGNRFQNIDGAVEMLSNPSYSFDGDSSSSSTPETQIVVNLVHTSMLHETAPMYVTDQPSFLNGVIEIETNLSPIDLLSRIKQVEAQIGRDLDGGIRYGPRPVDLDILFYYEKKAAAAAEADRPNNMHERSLVMDTPALIIPHPRMAERDFVMAPLCEVAGLSYHGGEELHHPVLKQPIRQLLQSLQHEQEINTAGDDNDPVSSEQQRVVVLPLPRDRMLYLNETVIMGILNVTPDSFSDGGKWNASLDSAVHRALEMEQEGAGIIDIGGESTRPGAKEVAIEEEMNRTIPIIERIRQVSDIPISIDTRHAVVAKAAIEAGADIVNDVSGGTFDPDMLPTVAELRVPIVLMHMRGTPETMQNYANDYESIVEDVTNALLRRCEAAEAAGIPRWMQIVDPGIGFAKDLTGNLSLLKHLNSLRVEMGMASTPILLGTSRKGFIGKLTGAESPENRDFGSVASCVAAMCLGGGSSNGELNEACNILRVHNVKGMKDAALVMDAIRRA